MVVVCLALWPFTSELAVMLLRYGFLRMDFLMFTHYQLMINSTAIMQVNVKTQILENAYGIGNTLYMLYIRVAHSVPWSLTPSNVLISSEMEDYYSVAYIIKRANALTDLFC